MADIIKNPIVIGVFAGSLTFLFMKWKYGTNQISKKLDRLNDNTKNGEGYDPKDNIFIIIPLIVAIISCVLAYIFVYYDTKNDTLNDNITPKRFRFSDENINKFGSDSSESAVEYQLISKGLNIPNKAIPDVFIETYS